jgi:hypothetical protein
MKLSKVCALVLLVVVGSAVAFADGIQDPKVIVGGAGGSGSYGACGRHQCQDVGLNFSMKIPESGKGYFYFTNASGKNWTSLALIVSGVAAESISCVQSFFMSCTTQTLKNGKVEILLSGVRHGNNPRNGILNGQNFFVGFACNPNCWPGGTVLGRANAGAVPEPATVALMMTGLGAMFSRRKLWRNRFNT